MYICTVNFDHKLFVTIRKDIHVKPNRARVLNDSLDGPILVREEAKQIQCVWFGLINTLSLADCALHFYYLIKSSF